MNHDVIKHTLLEVYRERLRQALRESDVVDAAGNVILTRDLKVRDKKSGYEYTIDFVKKDEDESDTTLIVLRAPDTPRFNPPADGPDIISSSLPEVDVYTPGTIDTDYKKKPTILVVSQEDFEKNFEVE